MDKKKCLLINNLFFLCIYIVLAYYAKYVTSYNDLVNKLGEASGQNAFDYQIHSLNYVFITCYFLMPLITQLYSYFYKEHHNYVRNILIIVSIIFLVLAVYTNWQAIHSDNEKFIIIVLLLQFGAFNMNKFIFAGHSRELD